MKERIILNGHDNTMWYHQGQERLLRSMEDFSYPVVTVNAEPGTGYKVKAKAWEYVLEHHPEATVIWADCSVWAIEDPAKLFDRVEEIGYFIQHSGYTVGETCNERTLKKFRVSREKAFDIPDCWTIVFGLDLANPIFHKMAQKFVELAGYFDGGKGQKSEERGTWMYEHRHDQSVMSLLLHKAKMTPYDDWRFCDFPNEMGAYREDCVFLMQGM